MSLDKKETIKELEKLASEVLSFKQERDLRRPILIEFCGSPKSGKSTTITSLNIFLKRNGFKTNVLSERASVCPVRNKRHPFFNIWTLTSAVAEIIQHLVEGKDKVDIIIADRGIFDSLCWFEWLNTNPTTNAPYLDDISYKNLRHFALMDFWHGYIDLIYVLQVKPVTSIKREYANLLTEKRGSIMTEPVLEGFNKSIQSVIEKHGNKFRRITKIDTDTDEMDDEPNRVSYEVTSNVLNILKDLLIEKIGYFEFPKDIVFQVGINKIDILDQLNIKYGNRDKVEKNTNYVQPIPIAVITNKGRDKVFVVKKSPKRTSKASPESDTLLLYIGGHVRIEDEKDGDSIQATIEKTLRREIQEEIGESISAKKANSFLIYTTDNPSSKKHVAVCHVIEMDLDDKKFKLTSDEFIMKTGTSKSGQILSINEVIQGEQKREHKLESWSIAIIKEVFNKDLSKKTDLFSNQIT